jgi:hypothetical protein
LGVKGRPERPRWARVCGAIATGGLAAKLRRS